MKQPLLLLVLLAITANATRAQRIKYSQYFEGTSNITINLDTTSGNTWQIGRPQKTIFDSAHTTPNVLVTDTVNTYPPNNTSIFTFGMNLNTWTQWGITAVRWMQKLDMADSIHGGTVEFSLDTGATWRNVFTDTMVYNFYGFKNSNKDTLPDGKLGFTGRDTTWSDIWLCYRYNSYQQSDSIIFKFTMKSDSTDNNNEGWMIDNLLVQETIFHTVSNTDPNQTFIVYPTLTDGIVKIESDKDAGDIDNIVVTDMNGKAVLRKEVHGSTTTIDISAMPAGNYLVGVHTQKKIEMYRITLQH